VLAVPGQVTAAGAAAWTTTDVRHEAFRLVATRADVRLLDRLAASKPSVPADAGACAASRPSASRHGAPRLRGALIRYAQPGLDGRLFVGPQGGIPRRRNFNRVYQHATRDRDRAIAEALDALIEASRRKIDTASGTDLARKAESA
jgi:hypothetical protein